MLYREIIAVYSQIHTKHINTLCGQNVGFYVVKADVSQSKHRTIVHTSTEPFRNFPNSKTGSNCVMTVWYSSPINYYSVDHIEDEMGQTGGTHLRVEKCIQYFGVETQRKEPF